MRIGKRTLLVVTILLFLFGTAYSQLIEIPIPRSSKTISQRLKTDTIPIDLPIWDDFSTSRFTPDTTYWVSGETIFINPGIGKNPPSLNVATFDGWDAYGTPYSVDPEARGATDSLVSRPINMGKVPSSLNQTVFLSFYYQKEGNGDVPNEGDSLILQFRKEDGSWETVWPLPGETISTVSNFFTQKILQVTPDYLYNGFQFKFQAHGRLNGPFDTWNVDYIYLDKRRDINDVSYLDRTFRTVPTSIFGPYTAIPAENFFEDPYAHLDTSSVDFINLERQVQPVEYTAITTDLITGQPIDTLILDSAFLALRFPLGQFTLESGLFDPQSLDPNSDSIVLQTTFYMDSGDDYLIDSISSDGQDTTRYSTVDLRVNDTTSVISTLTDYYAYDDGTAEFGAGINQLNGRLAYQYITNKPGYVTAIDINFLNIGSITAGTPIQLFVQDSLMNNFDIEESTNATVQVGETLDSFVTYILADPVEVIDTFYIGFQQNSDDFLAVGLDKNSFVENRIYFNVTGTWQLDTLITGNLMMRPQFGEDVVTGINDLELRAYPLYPNPTNGIVNLPFVPDEAMLYDLRGIQITPRWKGNKIDLSGLKPSVYILRLKSGEAWISRRVILKY
jgi:hypothetical protein